MFKVDPIDFGRRMAVERDMEQQIGQDCLTPFCPDVIFDETSRYLIYPTMVGIKIVKIETDEVVELLGKDEVGLRMLRLALFQGCAKKKGISMQASLGMKNIMQGSE